MLKAEDFAKAVSIYTIRYGRYPGALIVSASDCVEAAMANIIAWDAEAKLWKFLDFPLFLDSMVDKKKVYGVKRIPKRKESL